MWIGSKGIKQLYYAISKHTKAGVAILLSDKIDFRTKSITRYKMKHFIIKITSSERHNYSLNMSNKRGSEYTKQN